MSLGSIGAAILRAIADTLDGPQASPASAGLTIVADLKTATGAAIAVLRYIAERKLTLADAEAFANGVQQILVDLGVEPAIIFEASKLLMGLAPVIFQAWSSGMITGGLPPSVPPGLGPTPNMPR